MVDRDCEGGWCRADSTSDSGDGEPDLVRRVGEDDFSQVVRAAFAGLGRRRDDDGGEEELRGRFVVGACGMGVDASACSCGFLFVLVTRAAMCRSLCSSTNVLFPITRLVVERV